MIFDTINAIVVLVLSYLYAAVPFALIFTYLKTGRIITDAGTGNVGVINSFTVGGVWSIAFTVIAEISKAAVAIALAVRLGDGSLFIKYSALFAAFIGTNYSVFLKGKGGKGSTLFVWGQAFIDPNIAITLALMAAGLFLMTTPQRNIKRYWLAAIPPVFLVASGDIGYTLYGVISVAIMLIRTDRTNDDFQVNNYLLNRKSAKGEDISELALADPAKIGGKGKKIQQLMSLGTPVPPALVCTTDLFTRHLENPQRTKEFLEEIIPSMVAPDRKYAVRSSANVEDGADLSFAGQFDSLLNIQGHDDICRAIEKVWNSARSDRINAYCQAQGVDPDQIKMAVIIQEMVDPVMAGVAFSHNPLSGLHEVIIEAVSGLGDALVQGNATPERWSWKWGGWLEKPEQTKFDADVMKTVARQVETLWKVNDCAIDTEWAFDGETVYFLQMRDMTGVEEVNLYSNRLSKEFLPGAIKPLIWSVNIPLVNTAWVNLISEVTGPMDIDPPKLARSFYYRAYFNMGVFGRIFERLGFPPDGIEQIAGLGGDGPEKPAFRPTLNTLPLAPRMIACTWDKVRFEGKIQAFLKDVKPRFEEFATRDLSCFSDSEIIRDFDALYEANLEAAYFNVVTPLLNLTYHAGLNRKLKPHGLSIETLKEYADAASIDEDEDPNAHLADLNSKYRALPENLQQALKAGGNKAFGPLMEAELAMFKKSVETFRARFGHFSDSGNDFSIPPWREDPNLIIQMAINYARADGTQSQRTSIEDLPFRGLDRKVVNWLIRKSLIYKGLRDEVSSVYTLGYGLFRNHFKELGKRFADRGVIGHSDDIFYLNINEIRSIVAGGELIEPASVLTRKRRQEMALHKDVDSALPQIIYGDEEPVLRQSTGNILEGLATSGGLYTGNVCIVRGIRDFPKVQTGDVLVVPYSDVGWTPLFAKAGAIIAESGGMLSHSSIVAREYHIPAVVSVTGAGRLSDGDIVTVDGQQGLIRIERTARQADIGAH